MTIVSPRIPVAAAVVIALSACMSLEPRRTLDPDAVRLYGEAMDAIGLAAHTFHAGGEFAISFEVECRDCSRGLAMDLPMLADRILETKQRPCTNAAAVRCYELQVGRRPFAVRNLALEADAKKVILLRADVTTAEEVM